MEKIRLYKGLERTVAHSDEVEGILGDFAFEITGRARANLMRHHKHGTHKVTQDKGTVDHFVNLEGPASLAVENGWHTKDGGFVRGLDILKGAIL
jgi:hypothetical protein